ncbi:hypothetical protein FRC18_002918 [Serendipita sp. 400]|nr:hypothetical protein FRC18_002918 [Serendipita sp. 400]
MGGYTSLNNDILYHIFYTMRTDKTHGVFNLSMVNKRLRAIATPLIFDTIFFTHKWNETEEPWAGAEDSMLAILSNRDIVSSVRTFYCRPWISSSAHRDIPGAFFSLFISFPNLLEIVVNLQDDLIPQVQEEFNAIRDETKSTYLFAPSLRSLIISNVHWLFMAEYISNLECLVIEFGVPGYLKESLEFDIEKLGSLHPGLKKLHCRSACMTKNVQRIARCLPNIVDISLLGGVIFERDGRYSSILDHLSCYRAFPRLESIEFPRLSFLGLGFNPPTCGNAYTPALSAQTAADAKRLTRQILDNIEQGLSDHGGSGIVTIRIGGEIYERNTNGRFRKTKIITHSHTRRGMRVIAVKYVDNIDEG